MNTMLYGFDLGSNMIQVLKLEMFLGNLRIIHMSNNSIHDIRPLTMAPLLKELVLSDNQIRNIECLYAISTNQYLENIDLTGNPIMNDEQYEKILGTLFRNLKVFNKQLVCLNNPGVQKSKYTCSSPIKSAIIFKDTIKYLNYFLPLEERGWQSDPKLEDLKVNYQEVLAVYRRHENNISQSLGAYFGPYFVYLTGRANAGPDPSKRMEIQERRLSFLNRTITEIVEAKELDWVPTMETGLMLYLKMISENIDILEVIAIQSRWRMILARRQFRLMRESTIKIQKLIKRLNECATDKLMIINLKMQKRAAAAVRIQKWYRCLRMLYPFVRVVKKIRKRRVSVKPSNRRKSMARKISNVNVDVPIIEPIIEYQEMNDEFIADIPINHVRDTERATVDYNNMMKRVKAKQTIIKTQADKLESKYEQGEDNIPMPGTLGIQSKVNHYLQSKEPESFLTSSLAKQRTEMINQMTHDFNDTGEPISIPDGFLSAQRYITRKALGKEEKMKVASISSPVDNSLLIENIEKRLKPLHPERGYIILTIECHKSHQLR
jgi:hypothetical protein